MKKGQRFWTRDELILAINLYCKTQFGKLYHKNPDIIALAKLIDRTPSSVAYKLVNFASLDPSLKERGIKGASNASKLDKIIWDEFNQNREDTVFESERLLARLENKNLPETTIESDVPNMEGADIEAIVKRRVNQSFFRNMILASYNETCCITGIKQKELLVAGHIKPWALDKENRLNPRNGIAINSLHDRAFEIGMFTINNDYKIIIASELLSSKDENIDKYFSQYHEKEIILPSKFLPDKEFLEYHYSEKFRR